MLCLHGKPAGALTTKKGIFWRCQERKNSCHFICSEEQGPLYQKAVEAFLDTHQGQPRCCADKIPSVKVLKDDEYVEIPPGFCSTGCSTRRHAKMKVVTDMKNANFGRPFFICSKKYDRCNYFEWGNQKIVEKPLCNHGKQSQLNVVKNEGRNKGRKFFCCAEPNQCEFILWEDPKPFKKELANIMNT